MSASTSALLELAAAVLSRVPAAGRPAGSAAAAAKLCPATSTELCSSASAAPTYRSRLLVLHQRTGRLESERRLHRKRQV